MLSERYLLLLIWPKYCVRIKILTFSSSRKNSFKLPQLYERRDSQGSAGVEESHLAKMCFCFVNCCQSFTALNFTCTITTFCCCCCWARFKSGYLVLSLAAHLRFSAVVCFLKRALVGSVAPSRISARWRESFLENLNYNWGNVAWCYTANPADLSSSTVPLIAIILINGIERMRTCTFSIRLWLQCVFLILIGTKIHIRK